MNLAFYPKGQSKVPGECPIGQRVLERTSARSDVVAQPFRGFRTLPLFGAIVTIGVAPGVAKEMSLQAITLTNRHSLEHGGTETQLLGSSICQCDQSCAYIVYSDLRALDEVVHALGVQPRSMMTSI